MLNAKPLAELLDTIITKSKMLEGVESLALMNQLNTGIEVYEEKDVEPILEYGTERMVISLGREKLVLSGTGLRLLGMYRNELLIGGRVQNVEWT